MPGGDLGGYRYLLFFFPGDVVLLVHVKRLFNVSSSAFETKKSEAIFKNPSYDRTRSRNSAKEEDSQENIQRW